MVHADKPGEGSSGESPFRKKTIEVRFKLSAGVNVHVGDPVVVRAGIPLTLVSARREIGTFESARIAAGLRAGFTYSGAVASVDAAKRRGVARLQVS